MEHKAYAQSSTVKQDSMLSDTARLHDNLSEIRHRVAKIADMLHGPEPSPASVPHPPDPMPTVRRNIDHAFDAINHIHAELTRIENRL